MVELLDSFDDLVTWDYDLYKDSHLCNDHADQADHAHVHDHDHADWLQGMMVDNAGRHFVHIPDFSFGEPTVPAVHEREREREHAHEANNVFGAVAAAAAADDDTNDQDADAIADPGTYAIPDVLDEFVHHHIPHGD